MTDESAAEQAEQEPTAPAEGAKDPEQAPEQQAQQEEQSKAETGPPKEEASKEEKYQITAPEGIPISQPLLDGYTAAAQEAGISQEQAQKLVAWYAGQAGESQKSVDQQLEKQTEGWRNACRDDKEFGGARFEESQATIAKARDQFATPEMVKLLEDSGLGNHPEMNRLFYRIGKQISEDRTVGGAAPASNPLKAAYAKSWDQMTK